MDTPDKNRISAVSFRNLKDSPVFQYINDLSPIEPVKPARSDNILHSLAFTSPSSSLFTSPQINSYSRFPINRHRSLDLSSPVVLIGETVKHSPEGANISGFCEEQLPSVSETESFRDGCDFQMVSCDEAPMDAENEETGRGGSKELSDELCRRQPNDPLDSDVLLLTEDMEAESGFVTEQTVFEVAGIQNSDQQIPRTTDPIQSTAKAEDKEQSGLQHSLKQRSVRRRCLTFDVGGSYKRIPLRDSTNDLPPDFTSINKVHSPQKCLDTSKQETDEILPIPQTIGLHLNGFVKPSVSSDPNKLIFKDARVFPHGSTTFHHSIEDEFSTPVSTKRDLVSSDIKTMEGPEKSMEGECFDKHMATANRQLSQRLDEIGSCKRCRCRKSKCLKLYCDCFAAGLYCVEPCSCQNCFNKPIHEDIVMKTREQIEARNPLAFAPKVVSTSDTAIEFLDENNKTPASARHTRGCNCKKSGCLKKYCECFTMGVGCSSSCRCMGCKNIFGHTNEQCEEESDSVTINGEATEKCDHANASSQKEEISNSERRNRVLHPSSLAFRSLASL